MHIQNMHSLHNTGKIKNVKCVFYYYHAIIKFLGSLFKFKAEIGQINKNLSIEYQYNPKRWSR